MIVQNIIQRRILHCLCVAIFSLAPVSAQTVSDDALKQCRIFSNQPAQSLTGAVLDPSNARITSATVTLFCGEIRQQVHTDADGRYVIKASSGIYNLQVQAPGFAPSKQQVTLDNDASAIDVTLTVPQASNSVSVNAHAGYVAVQSNIGTKTDTPLIEIPQAISVVTRDQMDEQGIQSVPQALRYTSGIVSEQTAVIADAYETIYGRGFQLQEYLDGLRFPNMGYLLPSFDPFNLESIEVLHGPASVLYGQAYPAGIVNLVSKQPKHDPFHNLQLTTGSYNRYQGAWDFSGPVLQSQHLFYRLSGLTRHTDTQIDFVDQERYTIAPSLAWQPDEKTSVTALLNYQYDPRVGFFNFYPARGTVLANPNGKIPSSFNPGEPDFDRHARRQYGAGYLFTHRLSSIWSVQQNLRYTHLADNIDNVFVSDFDGNQTLSRYAFFNHEHVNETTLDTRATADFSYGSLRQTILAGVDYQAIQYVQGYGFDYSAPTINPFSPLYHQKITYPSLAGEDHVNQYQVGVYGQDQIRYKRWSFTLGGREDWAGVHDHEKLSNTVQTQFDHAFTGRAGAVYLLGHGITPYFSYSTSFLPQTGTTFEKKPLSPTRGQQYEVGLKYQPSNLNAFITMSAFNLTEQNVSTPDPAHPDFQMQTGEVRSRGLELEGHANLTNNLNLIASYSFLDNVITKSNDTSDSEYAPRVGKNPSEIPANMIAFWADYTFRTRVVSGFNLGSGVRLVGQSYGNSLNQFTVPSFTLVDATARYLLKALSTEKTQWQLSVNASNIADRSYVSGCSSTTTCVYGLRRNILGKIDLKW